MARRVVMIDDQASYTDALEMAFDFEKQLEVVGTATSSNAGVRIALELQPDLVLCDYRMPGDETGAECAARLRKFGFDGQIVILTGHAAPHVHAEAQQIDDVSVLSKMLNVDEIIENIAALDAKRESVSPELPSTAGIPAAPEPSPFFRTRWSQAVIICLLAAMVAGAFALLTSSDPASADDAADDQTDVAGTVLERPFVIIDGSEALHVVIEIDGKVSDSFTPSNLPATIALAVSPTSSVRVTVESLSADAVATCSVGVAKKLLSTSSVGGRATAVCSASPGDF